MAGENGSDSGKAIDGWTQLFDGHSLEGWRGYHSEAIPRGWTAENGILHFSNGPGNGDIVTQKEYQNFKLSLEWKVSPGGNSGIFYLATLGYDQIYLGAPEMQILDDERHADGGNPLTSAGAVYGLYPTPRGIVRPAGEWNEARIKVHDGKVTHWLNGEKIASYQLGSDEWKDKIANSKFKDWPMFAQARSGHIGLQDHGDPVWFRNIKIKELD